jgi:chemotaxis protein methyltransferase CheR
VAREGVYRKNSFRAIEDYYVKKYFFSGGDGVHKIADRVKSLVNFSYLNLLDPFKVKFLGHFDIIFCRNVMIYFDIESRKKVICMFYDRLSESGHLFLGHAESLINVTTAFKLRHLQYYMVYQKPDGKELAFDGKK